MKEGDFEQLYLKVTIELIKMNNQTKKHVFTGVANPTTEGDLSAYDNFNIFLKYDFVGWGERTQNSYVKLLSIGTSFSRFSRMYTKNVS